MQVLRRRVQAAAAAALLASNMMVPSTAHANAPQMVCGPAVADVIPLFMIYRLINRAMYGCYN